MKKVIIGLLVVFGIGIGANTVEETANASLLTKVASAVYIYKNRNEIKDIYQKAKTKAKTDGIPKFKVGNQVGNKEYLLVVTNKKTYTLGAFPTKFVQLFTQSKHDLKQDLQKIEAK